MLNSRSELNSSCKGIWLMVAGLFAAASLMFAAGESRAANTDIIDVDGSTITFNSPSGRTDNLTFSDAADKTKLHFRDATNGLTGSIGTDDAAICALAAGYASCDLTGITTVTVNLNDGNDSFSSPDIAVVQSLDVTVNGGVGNDTISLATTNTATHTLNGEDGNDTLTGGLGDDLFNGGTDTDTVSYSTHSSTEGVTASADGVANDGTTDEADNIGTDVENLTGGAGNDTFLNSELVSNSFNGGSGTDTVSYAGAIQPVNITIDGSANDGVGCPTFCIESDNVQTTVENVTGGEGNDVITGANSIANELKGGDGNDVLTGGTGNDTLYGGDGDDQFYSTGTTATDGADFYHGEVGDDTLYYTGRTAAITINLASGTIETTTVDPDATYRGNGISGENDRIGTSTENFYLGTGNDSFTGPCADIENEIHGDSGNDSFITDALCTTKDGPDDYIGEAGTDTVSYAGRVSDITAAIGSGSAGEDSEGDTIDSTIENLTGGKANDTLTGSDLANVLNGGDGNDIINAAAGNDTVNGGAGADTLSDGTGIDTLTGSTGDDTFIPTDDSERDDLSEASSGGTDTVDYSSYSSNIKATIDTTAYNDGPEGCVTGTSGSCDNISSNAENITTGSGNDTLTGSTAANVISAGDGDNLITGGSGDDILSGGEGTDIFFATGVGGSSSSSRDGSDQIDGGGGSADAISYQSRTVGVTVDLTTDGGNAGGGETDSYQNIENVSTGSGSDTVTGTDADNVILTGSGSDTIDGGAGADDIHGEAGTDTVTYQTRGTTEPITVTLDDVANDGSYCEDGSTECESDNINADVENLEGGAGDDSFYTVVNDPTADNTFTGGPGNDSMYDAGNSDGDDSFNENSDEGTDTYLYINHSDGVTADIGGSSDGSGTESDEIGEEVENITGGSGDDDLFGSDAANIFIGGEGNDVLSGLDGNDELVGNTGNDILLAGSGDDVITGDEDDDTIDGGEDTDTIDGGDGDDNIDGADGDDEILSDSFDGADILEGGAGTDTLNYSRRNTDLTVTAFDGQANDGEGCDTTATCENDNIGDGFEEIYTGSGDDQITGSETRDELLDAGSGDDTFTSSRKGGLDIYEGDRGTDTLDLSDRTADLTITLDSIANDGESCHSGSTTCELIDVKESVEELTLGSGNDTVVGDSSDERFEGGAGNDHFTGNNGSDHIDGGEDEDTVDYSSRSVNITVTDDGSDNDGSKDEGDNVVATERVLTGNGSDTVTGGDNTTYLETGGGNDIITGGTENEQVIAGAGADVISTSGGGADYVDCGEGEDDAANVDDSDTVVNCETVTGQTPPTTTTQPTQTTNITNTDNTTVSTTVNTTVVVAGADTVAPTALVTKPKCTLKKAKTKKAKAKAKKSFSKCKKKLKKDLKTTKPFRTLKGTAKDTSPTGTTVSGVKTVEINLVRKKGKKCQAFVGSRFKKQKSCKVAQGVWTKVTVKAGKNGTATWSKKIKGLQPKWAYTVRARATDASNNLQASGYGKLTFKPKKK